jgi:hypothetical protein
LSIYGQLSGYDRIVGAHYFIRVAVADHAAYEAFLTGKLIGLPGVLRKGSHLTMKTIKTGS